MTMPKLTAAEVQVLDAHLPAGLTDDMRDMALCLFEALVTLDSRHLLWDSPAGVAQLQGAPG